MKSGRPADPSHWPTRTSRQYSPSLGAEMTQIAEFATPTPSRGRQIRFTPERIQQIKNLVERGKGREEIAELIGTTVGSLQVTCSRLGISLRRPNFNNGIVSLRRNDPRLKPVPAPGSDHGGDSALLHLERNSQPGAMEQVQAPTPRQEVEQKVNEPGAATFAIRMQYGGEERTTELPLTQDMIGQLAFEAAFRNVSIGEFIGELIVAVVKQDLLKLVSVRNFFAAPAVWPQVIRGKNTRLRAATRPSRSASEDFRASPRGGHRHLFINMSSPERTCVDFRIWNWLQQCPLFHRERSRSFQRRSLKRCPRHRQRWSCPTLPSNLHAATAVPS